MANEYSLDLLLVNPGGRSQVYQSLAGSLSAIEPPIWAGLMATFTRRRGLSVQILDADAENLGPDEVAHRAQELDPLLTAVVVYGHQPSASTQNMAAAGAICTAILQMDPSLTTLLVGGHVAALPERTLTEEDADFVAAGEGLHTMVDLVHALRSRTTDFSRVPGLWYRDGAEVKNNPPAPLVINLEEDMPEMAWDLLPMDKYRAHNWHCFGDLARQPYGAIYTTLGCPYHCSFCCIQAPFQSGKQPLGIGENVNSYRFWSPQSVISQIDKLVNDYGIRNLRISDEMFVLNKKHVHGICDLIIERGYDLNMWSYARVDTIPADDTLEKLKRAGMNWLCFGIESASERVLQDVSKGYDQEITYRTMKQVRAEGINVIANYIFGLPEDDLESMQATLDMAVDLNCEFANFYSSMAYPGSGLFDLALEKGWPLPESWSGYSQHSTDTLPLPTNYLTGPDVLRFRDRAFKAYFTNPQYLDMLTLKFGQKTAEHIKEMSSHTLVRANS